MTTTVKINSSSIAKLKSAISSTDINAKKKLIAEVFVLAYGYEKVSKTTFEDWDIDEAIKRLKGIKCGPRPTSCPDQLATALEQYKAQQ